MANFGKIRALFLGSNIKSSIIQEYSKINQMKKISEGYFCTDINIKGKKYNLYFKGLNPKEAPKKNKDIEEYLNNFDIIFLVYDNDEEHPIKSIKSIWKVLEKNDSKLNTRYKILFGGEQDIKFLGFTFKKDPKKKA